MEYLPVETLALTPEDFKTLWLIATGLASSSHYGNLTEKLGGVSHSAVPPWRSD
jgi:hypothetical protein